MEGEGLRLSEGQEGEAEQRWLSHHAHPPALRYGAVQALDGAADGALYSDLSSDLQGVGLSSPCTSPATHAAAVPASSHGQPTLLANATQRCAGHRRYQVPPAGVPSAEEGPKLGPSNN